MMNGWADRSITICNGLAKPTIINSMAGPTDQLTAWPSQQQYYHHEWLGWLIQGACIGEMGQGSPVGSGCVLRWHWMDHLLTLLHSELSTQFSTKSLSSFFLNWLSSLENMKISLDYFILENMNCTVWKGCVNKWFQHQMALVKLFACLFSLNKILIASHNIHVVVQ
jgi:hypothetical protein